MNEREALLAARRQLMRTLADIAVDVADRAGERCPYRTAADCCTFAAPCRNQRRTTGAPANRCSGGPLNPLRAPASDA
jgi:hypothetical protein